MSGGFNVTEPMKFNFDDMKSSKRGSKRIRSNFLRKLRNRRDLTKTVISAEVSKSNKRLAYSKAG